MVWLKLLLVTVTGTSHASRKGKKSLFLKKQRIAYNRSSNSAGFVHYSECLYQPLHFYATQMVYHFLTSRILAIHDKG